MVRITTACPIVTDKYDSNLIMQRLLPDGAGCPAIERLLGGVSLRGKLDAIEPRGTVAHRQTAINKPADHQGVDRMLLGLDAIGHVLFTVAGEDRDFGLQDHRSAVQLVGNEMHGGAVLFVAVGQRLTVGMQARVFRQQGGVDIQQAALIVGI